MNSVNSPKCSPPIRRKWQINKRFQPFLLILPALLVCIGILIPFFSAAIYSLQRYRLSQPWANQFNWGANYVDFISDASFWHSLKISLRYAGGTVFLELVLGLAIAVLLQKPTRTHNFIVMLLMMPLMVAPALAALMWKLMTNPNFGILNYLLAAFGISDFRWASTPETALFTVMLVDLWIYTPFIVILLLAGLRALPAQPFEAASLDNIPPYLIFWRLTLPMLMPYIVTAVLFRLLDALQQFDIIYAITQGGPGDRLMVLQIEAYLTFFQSTNIGRSAALMMILWAITYFLSHIFIKYWLMLRAHVRREF